MDNEGEMMTLEKFNSKYFYISDKEKYNTSLDIWEEMEPDNMGHYKGDCESYCITLKKNVPAFEDWDYYYCKLNGVGHCFLYKNGETIDCNSRRILNLGAYYDEYNITELKKYNKIQVFIKKIFAKIYTKFNKGKI